MTMEQITTTAIEKYKGVNFGTFCLHILVLLSPPLVPDWSNSTPSRMLPFTATKTRPYVAEDQRRMPNSGTTWLNTFLSGDWKKKKMWTQTATRARSGRFRPRSVNHHSFQYPLPRRIETGTSTQVNDNMWRKNLRSRVLLVLSSDKERLNGSKGVNLTRN